MKKMQSATQRAFDWLEKNPGATVYAAAKHVGISPTTLYTAIARRKAKEGRNICPTCGRAM